MSTTITPSELSIMTMDVVPLERTLWDYLPKVKADSSVFSYTKRDNDIRRLPDVASAGAGMPSLRTSKTKMLTGMTQEYTAGATINSGQKSALGSRLATEREYLISQVKTDLLYDLDKTLYDSYGTITTSGSYGHSGTSWAASSTAGAQMNQIVQDIVNTKATVKGNIGKEPNVLMINSKGYDALLEAFLDSGNYNNELFTGMIRDGKVTDLKTIMGLELWVTDVTSYNGTTHASLWGDYAWFMYIDKNPSMISGTPTFGFIVESGVNGTNIPWYTREIDETESDLSWQFITKYQGKFVETRTKALYRMDSSSSGDLY